MEDLLPILIGILWVAYTLYNRGQKKKRSAAPISTDENSERKPSFIEQLLMGGEVEESQPYENTELFPISEEPAEEVSVNGFVPESRQPFLRDELANYVQVKNTVLKSVDDEKENVLAELEIETFEFDLKKAILYSEILNAPYIGYK
ncbi:MAG: hypothetical protein R2764_09095 [Bacteroidales bacterium]